LRETLVRMHGSSVEIRNDHFPNTSHKHKRMTEFA